MEQETVTNNECESDIEVNSDIKQESSINEKIEKLLEEISVKSKNLQKIDNNDNNLKHR